MSQLAQHSSRRLAATGGRGKLIDNASSTRRTTIPMAAERGNASELEVGTRTGIWPRLWTSDGWTCMAVHLLSVCIFKSHPPRGIRPKSLIQGRSQVQSVPVPFMQAGLWLRRHRQSAVEGVGIDPTNHTDRLRTRILQQISAAEVKPLISEIPIFPRSRTCATAAPGGTCEAVARRWRRPWRRRPVLARVEALVKRAGCRGHISFSSHGVLGHVHAWLG